jgi:hypothetical protein
MKKDPYVCVCCGYKTDKRPRMQDHLYKTKKPCPKSVNDVDLNDDIRQYILKNRVYHIQVTASTTINQTINQYNQINNFLNGVDVVAKLDRYASYNKIELLDFQDKVDSAFRTRVKKLNHDDFKYGFHLRREDLMQVLDEMSVLLHGDVEQFNIVFDDKMNKLKILDSGSWETFLVDNGIKKLISVIQDSYFDAYECYLLRKLKTGSPPNDAQHAELLVEYYKFIGCFDADPYIKTHQDADILDYGNTGKFSQDTASEEYGIQEEYMPKYKVICDKISKGEIVRIKKEVVDILKRNSKHNVSELNKKMISLLHMDDAFKKDVLTMLAASHG